MKNSHLFLWSAYTLALLTTGCDEGMATSVQPAGHATHPVHATETLPAATPPATRDAVATSDAVQVEPAPEIPHCELGVEPETIPYVPVRVPTTTPAARDLCARAHAALRKKSGGGAICEIKAVNKKVWLIDCELGWHYVNETTGHSVVCSREPPRGDVTQARACARAQLGFSKGAQSIKALFEAANRVDAAKPAESL